MAAEKSAVRLLGRYDLVRQLGAGEMGVVYLAHDVSLRREVALKRMTRGPQSRARRFRRECQALAAVHHPGVPSIYEWGDLSPGEPYFTMEVVTGETLAEHLRHGPVEPVRALALAISLGRVLSAVHAAGIVHRDVKPANIILAPDDRVRLVDFGACYLLPSYYAREHLRDAAETSERWMTGDTDVVGTQRYTDPEYIADGRTTVQSDVFSVCVILYEMLTGRSLFDERVQGHREVLVEEFTPELVPLAVELQRGTSLAAERHRSMGDLVRRLEIVRNKLTVTPHGRKGEPRWLRCALAAATILAGGTTLVASRVLALHPAPLHMGRHAEDNMPLDSMWPLVQVVPPLAESHSVDTQPAEVKPTRRAAKRPTTWARTARQIEASVRRCLEAGGAKPRPLLVTISASAPVRVRGVAADSPHARCFREVIEALDLRTGAPQRQHIFFER